MSTSISPFRPTVKKPQFSGFVLNAQVPVENVAAKKVSTDFAELNVSTDFAELAKKVEELQKRKASNTKTNWWSGILTGFVGILGIVVGKHESVLENM